MLSGIERFFRSSGRMKLVCLFAAVGAARAYDPTDKPPPTANLGEALSEGEDIHVAAKISVVFRHREQLQ